MKIIKYFLIFLLSIIKLSFSHPTIYSNIPRNQTCYGPTPAKIYSWHIHVLYWQNHKEHAEGARQLRQKFIETFSKYLKPGCHSLYHNNNMCMFEDSGPGGPFLTAQWAVFVTPEHFEKTVIWIMQNRGKYDVLVHPNSGCELADHSSWAFWGGNKWELDMTIFSHDYPFPWPDRRRSGGVI
jgi:aromatic ring-cleaving dioxygenase